jgi:hypothetical protein
MKKKKYFICLKELIYRRNKINLKISKKKKLIKNKNKHKHNNL